MQITLHALKAYQFSYLNHLLPEPLLCSQGRPLGTFLTIVAVFQIELLIIIQNLSVTECWGTTIFFIQLLQIKAKGTKWGFSGHTLIYTKELTLQYASAKHPSNLKIYIYKIYSFQGSDLIRTGWRWEKKSVFKKFLRISSSSFLCRNKYENLRTK